MILKELQKTFVTALIPIYGVDESHSFFYLACEKFLKKSRSQIALHINQNVSFSDLSFFKDTLERLRQEEPIQYILGEAFFYDAYFKVNKNVLIPRPETESLVRWIIADMSDYKTETIPILDIGTGSGCIAITLAKEIKGAHVSAIDISREALQIATDNAIRQEQSINWIQQDILAIDTLPSKYEVVVSNPPYVRHLEKKQMQDNVLLHEPELALFVTDEHPLLFYHKIAELGKKHIKEGGYLYFEINEYLGTETQQLLHEMGYKEICLKKDFYGKHRFIKAKNL